MEYDRPKDADTTGTLAVDGDEHVRLVAEIPVIQRLPIGERLLLARRRRLDQVTRYERLQRHSAAGARHSRRTGTGHRGRRAVRFDGVVALQEAVRRNDVDEVRALLQCSPRGSVNATVIDGLTALHQACIDGSADMVNVLLSEFSADVNCRDDDQWTPLHTVALCGHALVARHLIDCGADVLALNSDGNMPYDLCDDELTLDVIESAMAKQGVTQQMINDLRVADEEKMLRELRRMSRKGHDLQFRGRRGETPLHVAACNGYVVVGEFLLGQLVDVNAVDDDWWTPIHHAAFWKQVAMLELLVQHGADITAAAFDGRTPCDVCSDAAVYDWLMKLRAIQSLSSPTSYYRFQPSIAPTAAVESKALEGSHTGLYSSNLSLADKSTLISTSKRLDSVAEKLNSRSRRKDARDEAQLWSSMQSLVDDEDLLDSLSRSAADARSVPPAQFRRPTPPSLDDQLQLIAEKLRDDDRLSSSTSPQQATSIGKALTSGGADSATSHRSNIGDDRRERDDGSKSKSARSGRRKNPDKTVDSSNWQLKSSTDSGRVRQTVKPSSNIGVTPSSKHKSTKNSVTAAEQMNGQAVNVSDKRSLSGRGQTSAELKQRRSTQRQNNILIMNHDDRLTSACDVHKKPEFVAVDNAAKIKFNNKHTRRCNLM